MKTNFFTYQKYVDHVETDESRVVHFANYNIYMENAFFNYLRDVLDLKTFSSEAKNLRVVYSSLIYKNSLTFGDKIVLLLSIENMSICSFQISFEFRKNLSAQEIARGSLRFAYVKDDKILPLPKFLLNELSEKNDGK